MPSVPFSSPVRAQGSLHVTCVMCVMKCWGEGQIKVGSAWRARFVAEMAVDKQQPTEEQDTTLGGTTTSSTKKVTPGCHGGGRLRMSVLSVVLSIDMKHRQQETHGNAQPASPNIEIHIDRHTRQKEGKKRHQEPGNQNQPGRSADSLTGRHRHTHLRRWRFVLDLHHGSKSEVLQYRSLLPISGAIPIQDNNQPARLPRADWPEKLNGRGAEKTVMVEGAVRFGSVRIGLRIWFRSGQETREGEVE